ncbi:MAG: metallophosphoesterase family protein [Synergistaceae bacterium]|nr:metallophosphoesterase family protein [Synergistaceae bacterium]
MRFFTSDQHFFDCDIMDYCDRPYEDASAMNEGIISRFNDVARDASEVYMLGDIFGTSQPDSPLEACRGVLERLGARERPFHLIAGNHDNMTREEYLEAGFASVKHLDFIKIGDYDVMLTHDPCMIQPKNTLALCGHIHTLFRENWQPERNTLAINVCVEVRDYKPVSERDILDIVARSDYRR